MASAAPVSTQADDPLAAARSARLRHITDDIPGIARRRAASGFDYLDPDGHLIGDFATLSRIKALAIPPAWTAVWICPLPNGHIQATGRNARGRKQYRYHSRWRETRDETKFDRMLMFSRALPRIRARVDADLRRHGLQRERVLAAIVRLLELTLFRIGNSEYSKANNSFGLTTLRNRHAAVSVDTIRLAFRGKSGVWNESRVSDRRLARIVKRCRDLPGHELFQYVGEDGHRHTVGSYRGQCVFARDQRRRDHRQGFSNLGRDVSRRLGLARARAGSRQGTRFHLGPRRRTGFAASREHRRRLPQMLHSPGDFRWLSRWVARQDLGTARQPLSIRQHREDERRGSRGYSLSPLAAPLGRKGCASTEIRGPARAATSCMIRWKCAKVSTHRSPRERRVCRRC